MDYEIFELGDVALQAGLTLRATKLAYKAYGQLNDDKSNVIIFPTHYSGQHTDNEAIIGEGKALDPKKYFIIVVNLFGNGLSSSPSNTAPPFDKARFPQVTLYDNVLCQHRLVTEKFGIEKIALVVGFSMGVRRIKPDSTSSRLLDSFPMYFTKPMRTCRRCNKPTVCLPLGFPSESAHFASG